MKKIILVTCHLSLVTLYGCGKLSEQTLGDWRGASESVRDKFVATYFAENPDFVKNCITRMSLLPDTEGVSAMDAGRSCLVGLELKQRNAAAKNAKRKK